MSFIAVAIGGGLMIGGAVGTMTNQAEAPTPRSLEDEIAQILRQAGPMYESEAEYGPQYDALTQQRLRAAILGQPAGTQEYWTWNGRADQRPPAGRRYGDWVVTPDGYYNTRTGVFSATVPEGMLAGTKRKVSTVPTEAQGGLLDLYRDVMPEINALNTASREASYNDIRNLNPDSSRLADMLGQAGAEDVALGSRLDPQQIANIRNSVMGEAGGRGWGFNPGDMARVGMETGAAGEALRTNRLARGRDINEFLSRNFTLPALGYAPPTSSGAITAQGSGMTQSPNILALLSGYASDLNNTNYNAEAAANIANFNSRNDMFSSMMGIGGTIGGGSSLFG
jgi:hypothetical protein